MERELAAQVASPVFFHHHHPNVHGNFHDTPPLPRKRDFSWQNHAFIHQQQQQHQSQKQRHMVVVGAAPPSAAANNWNAKDWDWDCFNFTAKRTSDTGEGLRLVTPAVEVEQKKKGDDSSKSPSSVTSLEEDGENLTLKLGGGTFPMEDPMTRPNKKVRSGSPGNGGGSNYPMCQVDDCKTDLSGAKDYHRRHKVCELHSKTTKALVGKQMQRFCQQCSRFHPLSEFDEGKRSCRRRLAGHNRRRRKTQPEDAPRLLLPGNQENATTVNLDVVNLLATLTRLQGNGQGKPGSMPSLHDKDHLLQLISKINTLNHPNRPSRSSAAGGFDLNISQAPQQVLLEQITQTNEKESVPSTMNLLAVLSAALTASAPDTLVCLSQGSSESSGNDKTKATRVQPVADVNERAKSSQISPSAVGRDSCISQATPEATHQPFQESRPSLQLQLFGSADGDSPPKLSSALKYLSSESSNPMEDRSPSSSPPVTRKLFPLHSTDGCMKRGHEANCRGDNAGVELSSNLGRGTPFNILKESERQAEHRAVQNTAYYTSSSSSDHSPSSSNSQAQDRTGRIIFKLFGKDPSSFPCNIRAEILNWLSNIPTEMESYIRPGCVVLSIHVSMPAIAWEELEGCLLYRATTLVQQSESEFWRSGRFLVRTNKQLISHKDGKIHLSRSWRTWSAPELTLVSPVAVVSGQETTLTLKGRNLTVPGTKIYCSYMGKYTSKEVLCSAYPGTIYDDSSIETFDLPGGFPNVLGRCFLEVENGFKGNSFPVIIADSSICSELRDLEYDLGEDIRSTDISPYNQVQDTTRPQSRDDILHFLNELGWLFQKMHSPIGPSFQDFSTGRFKYLLAFSVEHDWCTLTKTLLGMLVERGSKSDDLKQESLEMLSEVHLLNRAVKRKCRKMVDLLLHYSVRHENGTAEFYPFPPNMAGPGGLTPLHLAASLQDSEDLIDALTNDPQEIGLNCWSSLRDDNNQSPCMYAVMRNNHAYNRLVARKAADRDNNQITISIGEKEVSMDKSWIVTELNKNGADPSQARTCTQCALVRPGRPLINARTQGLLQRPYIHSMLAIAAVCVCVCLFFRGSPEIGRVEPFKWENLDFGPL